MITEHGRTINPQNVTNANPTDGRNVELMCVKCGKRWDTELPLYTRLKDIRCPLCGLDGYIINTGQQL
jgi:hypothetical protein